MLKVLTTPTFTHEVAVMQPVDGGHEEHSFKATFKMLPDDEFDDLDLRNLEGAREMVRRVLVGASDIVDGAGKPVEWSSEVRDWLINTTVTRSALILAYHAAVNKVRAGN